MSSAGATAASAVDDASAAMAMVRERNMSLSFAKG
jgi:hypothetical protein